MNHTLAVDRGGEMAEREKQAGPGVKELPATKKDEIEEIVEEFFKEDVAKEAEQAKQVDHKTESKD